MLRERPLAMRPSDHFAAALHSSLMIGKPITLTLPQSRRLYALASQDRAFTKKAGEIGGTFELVGGTRYYWRAQRKGFDTPARFITWRIPGQTVKAAPLPARDPHLSQTLIVSYYREGLGGTILAADQVVRLRDALKFEHPNDADRWHHGSFDRDGHHFVYELRPRPRGYFKLYLEVDGEVFD